MALVCSASRQTIGNPACCSALCSQGASEPVSWPTLTMRLRKGLSAALIAAGSVGVSISRRISPSLLMTQIAVLRVETSKPAKQSIPGLPRPPGERDGARESTGGVGASLDDGRRSVRTGARGHYTLLLSLEGPLSAKGA